MKHISDKSDFTQGSIPQNIVRMAVPMTAALLIIVSPIMNDKLT